MNIPALIETLDRFKITVELGINCKSERKPPPEAEELMRMLTGRREETIDHLLQGRFVPLPSNTPIPAGWRDGDQRTKQMFRAAYDALEKHRGAATVEEFKAAADEFSELSKSDPLLCDLLVAVYGELSREYREVNGLDGRQ